MQLSEARVAAALGRAAAAGTPGGASPPPSPTGGGGRNPFGAEARLDLSSRLKLDQIRVQLLRQEDNILFGWVKRSAYRRNAPVYQPAGMAQFLPDDPAAAPLSLLLWHLQQTEARCGREKLLRVVDQHLRWLARRRCTLASGATRHLTSTPSSPTCCRYARAGLACVGLCGLTWRCGLRAGAGTSAADVCAQPVAFVRRRDQHECRRAGRLLRPGA